MFDSLRRQCFGNTHLQMAMRGCEIRPLVSILTGLLCILVLMVPVSSDGATADDIGERRRELQTEFDRALNSLIQRTRNEQELTRLESWRLQLDPSRQYVFVPSEADVRPSSESTGQQTRTEQSDGFVKLRLRHASAVYRLVDEAVSQGNGALALQMLNETVCFDPHHSDARRRLQLPQRAGAPRQIARRRGRKPQTKYNWPAGQYIEITTPHFRILTDDTADNADELANRLETLKSVWEQLFFDVWADAASLNSRAPKRRRSRRHQVVLFRSRDGYLSHVSRLEQRARMTRGYYHADTRTAFLYGGESPETSPWHHEVTHQLFHELARADRRVGFARDFWVVEGVALYMESLQACRRWLTVGGLEADRLQFARFRALRERYQLPLAQLTMMGRDELQQHDRIGAIYSQSAGLSHFMMQANQSRWRPQFIKYLQLVYRNRADDETLPALFQMPLTSIDQAYVEFLSVHDQDLQRLDPQATIHNLCIGGTQVSDAGLAALPSLAKARWIDLYGTSTTDHGTSCLQTAKSLEQITLEQTQIGDETVSRLQFAHDLKSLDLSQTKVTDTSLTTVARLSQLESLWLTGTGVTDAGLMRLGKMKSLRQLDVAGTHVTAAGKSRLHAVLPRLKIN